MHISITSNENKDKFTYVMKDDTRLEGPWTNKDEPEYIPKAFTEKIKEMWAWQQKVIDKAEELVATRDTRKVIVVLGKEGHNGKSGLYDWLVFKLGWKEISDISDTANQLMGCCIKEAYPKREVPGWVLNMPKAMEKKQAGKWLHAVENIREGRLWDTRYGGNKWRMEPAPVVIMTNDMIPKAFLSEDRWWIINIAGQQEQTVAEIQAAEAAANHVPNVEDVVEGWSGDDMDDTEDEEPWQAAGFTRDEWEEFSKDE